MMPPSKESHTSFVVAQGCLQRLNDLANAAHNNSPASVAVTTGKQPHDGTLVEQLTANSNTDYCHSQPCQADVCFRAAAPATPPPAQRAQHAVLKNQDTKPAHSTCSNILMPVTGAQPDRDCTEEADQKLLWWPVDHVTVNKSRLAVGDSCYIITGQCVLCHVDDDLDMVECTRCSRFTHFQCTLPQLIESPQGDFFCHFCSNHNPVPSQTTVQAMVDADTPGVGVMWVTFMYCEMDVGGWQSQSVWLQGFMYNKVPGPGNELVLSSTPADGVTPDAVLGVCPVNAQSPCAFGSPSRQSHYWSTTMDDGTKLEWEQLLFDSTLHQYENMYSEHPPKEMEQFIHSYRLPAPETYKAMLTPSGLASSKYRLANGLRAAGNGPGEGGNRDMPEAPQKRHKVGDEDLRRVRSLVQPLQVEVATKMPLGHGPAVDIYRYMAAGSCIGIEVWQRPGLFGAQLEDELTSLVQDWEAKDASTHDITIVDSTTAKRRKVYFGCRDIHNDPQLYWDVEPVPTVVTDRLVPRLVELGVITSESDVHQAVLNVYHKGGYLVAHQDSEAQYQQPVVMIQVRSESALSFGYKAGGWSHLNENLRFLRIHKPLFSLTVLKNEVFNVLKHCVCSGDTQSGQCATLVLRNITPCQKP